MLLRRLAPSLTALFVAAVGVSAQAPIERRDPPRPLPTWPVPDAFFGHTHVLISTFDTPGQYLCQVRNIEPDRLICGGYTASAVFDRERVSSISTSPGGYVAVEKLQKPLLEGGLAIGSIGLFCGVDGGPVCRTPTIVGLSMIAASIILQFVKLHQRHHLPQLLYAAPPPPPLPDPRF